jgi:membrane protein required for colicin V production
MTPQILNTILFVIVCIFIANGFFQGLIHMLGSLLGLVIGVFLASRYNAALGSWLAGATGWNKSVMAIVAFVLTILVITRLFGYVVHFLEKTFHIMKIPLIGLANRLAGAFFGFFEGIFVVGATLIVINSMTFVGADKLIGASTVAVSLIASSKILLPLLPKTISDLYR